MMCAVACSVVCGFGATAAAADRCLIIDDELAVIRASVAEVNDRNVVLIDDHRVSLELERTHCVAIIPDRGWRPRLHLAPTEPAEDAPAYGLLLLSDGQRFPGLLDPAGSMVDGSLRWSHPWLHTMVIELDKVMAVVFGPDIPLPEARDGDVVILRNGDVLEGFLTSFDDPLTIEMGDAAAPERLDVPLNRIAAVRLVSRQTERRGTRVWTTDGTVLDVAGFRLADDGFVRLEHFGRPVAERDPIRFNDVAAVLLETAHLEPLSALTPEKVTAPPTRYEASPPRVQSAHAPLGASPIELRGPLVVRYRLPRDAERLAMEAVLPPTSRTWGDLNLIVRNAGRVVFEAHLNRDHPRAEINIELEGRDLEIELTAGRYGPIQDRILLNRALLLVR